MQDLRQSRSFAWGVLLCAALLGALLEPADAQIKIKHRTGRKTYHFVGMVPFPGRFFVRKYRPSLVEYLNERVGPKFDPPINFTIRHEPAYIIEPFDDPLENKRDFAFVYPNMAGCLEAEFLSTPLVTVRNYRGGQELNHYGGVVFTAANRDDINSIEDLRGGVVTASNFKLCQHQWRVFDDNNVHLFAETKQVRFTNAGDEAIIQDVLLGMTDAAFTRTDAIEARSDKDKFKILSGGLPDPYLEGAKFPFQTTSELYPEYAILAGEHVEWEIQREVLQALLEVTNETQVCGPAYAPVNTAACAACSDSTDANCFRDKCTVTPACGKLCGPDFYPQLSNCSVPPSVAQGGRNDCVYLLCNAQIASYQPALSYGPARDLYQTLGLMNFDGKKRRWRCVRAEETWDGISCPADMFKLSRKEVETGCADRNVECPEGYMCLCQPCKRAKEVEIVPGSAQGKTARRSANASVSSWVEFRRAAHGVVGGCDKMSLCGKLRQNEVLDFALADNKLRKPAMNLTWSLREGSEVRSGEGAAIGNADAFDSKYTMSVQSNVVGVHVLEIMLGGVQVPASPVLITVEPAVCDDEGKVADAEGNCVCNVADGWTAVAGGNCMKVWALVLVILLPLLFFLLFLGFLYIQIATKMADSIWEIKLQDLIFDQPPEVLGRGTFGLVVAASYNTTRVAVKRVIPPRSSGSALASQRSVLFSSSRQTGKLDELFEIKDDAAVSTISDEYDELLAPEAAKVALSRSGHDSVVQLQSQMGTMSSSDSRTLMQRLFPFLYTEHGIMRSSFIEEMRYLSKMRHPCITTVMGAVVAADCEPMLVMELMEHGSLHDLIHNYTMVLDGEIVIPLLGHVCQGLSFLHAANPQIIHGDLKAANVLVDSKFRAKVADFGLTAKKTKGATGTPFWMAPELLLGELNSVASDIYAFGITLWEVYARSEPYLGEEGGQVIMAVANLAAPVEKRPEMPEMCPGQVQNLMKACWHKNPDLRPRFDEIDRVLKTLDPATMGPEAVQAKDKHQHGSELRVLHDVFPRHIADKIVAGVKIEPEHKECVTIFFSDIVGFTDISSTLEPVKVSRMLDRLYTVFDALSNEHRVFKVETIGDAYMAVTNLVENQEEDHAVRIAHFAIHAVEAAASTLIDEDDPGKGTINIRVGFHSGPVVANVVGSRNPRYCLFGDTVNTASRMESNSKAKRIQCSERSAKILKQQLRESASESRHTIQVVSRGEIPIKGKGTMQTYWVSRGSLMPEATVPMPPHSGAWMAGDFSNSMMAARDIAREQGTGATPQPQPAGLMLVDRAEVGEA